MNPANMQHSRWCGLRRFEKSLRIYEALRNNGLNGNDLAKAIGVSRQCVSRTINGASHSPRILDALRENGVPEKYLFDPRLVESEQIKVRAVA